MLAESGIVNSIVNAAGCQRTVYPELVRACLVTGGDLNRFPGSLLRPFENSHQPFKIATSEPVKADFVELWLQEKALHISLQNGTETFQQRQSRNCLVVFDLRELAQGASCQFCRLLQSKFPVKARLAQQPANAGSIREASVFAIFTGSNGAGTICVGPRASLVFRTQKLLERERRSRFCPLQKCHFGGGDFCTTL